MAHSRPNMRGMGLRRRKLRRKKAQRGGQLATRYLPGWTKVKVGQHLVSKHPFSKRAFFRAPLPNYVTYRWGGWASR